MKRRKLKDLCLICMCLFLGCRGGDSTSGTAGTGTEGQAKTDAGSVESRGTIGFSALDLKNPFFKVISDQLTSDAEAAGFKVIVNNAESNVNTQAKQVDSFIAQKVTAIVINPADRIAIASAVKKANDAGVPVFTCDLQVDKEAGVDIVAHVGTNNYEGGHLAGKAMIEALGEAGGDALILHFAQANSCVERVNGFTDEINEYNAGRSEGKINIVSTLEGGGSRDIGFKATSDGLQQHPNLVGIFAINDPSALGAVSALEQSGKADQVKVIGFDGQLEGKQAIKEGKIYADPIQFPKVMATMTVENIVKYLDGAEFDKVHLLSTELYRKADAENDPELQ